MAVYEPKINMANINIDQADPRADVLDKVTVENKYATNIAFLTTLKYSYSGAFKGSYEGRVI